MNAFTDLLLGSAEGELVSPEPGAALSYYTGQGFTLYRPRLTDPLTLRFYLPSRQQKALESKATMRGDSFRVIKEKGGRSLVRQLLRRLPMGLAVFFMLVFAMCAGNRLWFFQVEGNRRLSTETILAAARDCGLNFWSKTRELDRERVKNDLLNALPDLQWAGINLDGGILTICVRERIQGEMLPDRDSITDVIAARDGLVVSMDVTGGQAKCQVGQAVTRGEILVTGIVEHEYQPQLTHAEAEVYALTQRQLRGVLPSRAFGKTYTGETTRAFSLVFGRKKIKIFGNSGISGTTCDRMYEVRHLILPGGYRLPLAFLWETAREYTLTPQDGVEFPEEAMSAVMERLVREDMIAGELLHCSQSGKEIEGAFELNAIYSCREMIARERNALQYEGDVTNDGTNRERGTGGGAD